MANFSVSLFEEMTAPDCKPRNWTAMLPRLPISHCFPVCAWRWLTDMIKDTWLSACLEAFQGLNQWKQLGFIFNLITLWKSLVYKHICLTSNHSDPKLRSPASACCHVRQWDGDAAWRCRRLPGEYGLLDLQQRQLHYSLLSSHPENPSGTLTTAKFNAASLPLSRWSPYLELLPICFKCYPRC